MVNNAKSDIKNLHTISEVDVYMNAQVYSMFDLVEKSITLVYNYMIQKENDAIADNMTLDIKNSPYKFYNGYLSQIANPFAD